MPIHPGIEVNASGYLLILDQLEVVEGFQHAVVPARHETHGRQQLQHEDVRPELLREHIFVHANGERRDVLQAETCAGNGHMCG